MRAGPVGVFDSGLGGLTVVRAIVEALPGIELIYFGDTARIPYGTKSAPTVTRYAREIAAVLLEAGARVLVVACNTASALALPELARHVSAPVLGVLEPGAAAAVEATSSGHVTVLGTRSTIASGAYARCILELRPDAVVQQIACPLFVPLVEEQWLSGPVAEQVVDTYLGGLDPATDTVLLGCTHYPLLRPLLAQRLGPGVRIIDSAQATALALRRLVAPDGWVSHAPAWNVRALVSDAPDAFATAGAAFLGRPLDRVEWHRW